MNPMAGATTIYGVELPLATQIPAAGIIDVIFPEGVDVTNAKGREQSKNSDLNGGYRYSRLRYL